MTGTFIDAATKRPLPGVAVVATSHALQGERSTVTDPTGTYALAGLPSSPDYTLQTSCDGYQPWAANRIDLPLDTTKRVNAELSPDAAGAAPSAS
jgi:hypothetical protein